MYLVLGSVPAWSWGGYLVWGVYLVQGEGVPDLGGVPGPRGYTWSQEVPGPGGCTCLVPGGTYPGTPLTRYPWDQVHPRTRYTPGPGTPFPQEPGTPLGTRYKPPEQCMLGDTGNKRAVRILLECILVGNRYLDK